MGDAKVKIWHVWLIQLIFSNLEMLTISGLLRLPVKLLATVYDCGVDDLYWPYDSLKLISISTNVDCCSILYQLK